MRRSPGRYPGCALTGKIRVEYDEDFGGDVCALQEISREVLEDHDDDYVYFT